MERDLLLVALLAFAAWRYVQSMMSNTPRAVLPFEKAQAEIRTGDMLVVGDCGGGNGRGFWAAATNAAVRIADMSPWTEVCVAKRTSEGRVEVWQPSAYALVPLADFAAANAGCLAVRPLQCSESQRQVIQAQFDAAVQHVQAAGTANAVDAVSSYLYRHTQTNNPRPAHTGLTASESAAFFYHSCGVLQDHGGVYGTTPGRLADAPPTAPSFSFGPAVFVRPPRYAAVAADAPLHPPQPTEQSAAGEAAAGGYGAQQMGAQQAGAQQMGAQQAGAQQMGAQADPSQQDGGWPSRESAPAAKAQVVPSETPPLSAQSMAAVPGWFSSPRRSAGNR